MKEHASASGNHAAKAFLPEAFFCLDTKETKNQVAA
jgi:hypothetical protein